MTSTWRTLLARRDLIGRLLWAELKASRLQSAFGWVWWLIDPLLMMGIYWAILVVVLGKGREAYAPYPVFLLCALVTWKHLSHAATAATKVLRQHEGLIKAVPIPTMTLPLAQVLASFTYFLGGFAVLAGAAALAPGARHSGDLLPLLQVPALMALQVVVVTGVSLGLACLGVLVLDLQGLLGHALRVGFYLSPGLYGLDLVEEALAERAPGALAEVLLFLYTLNPFALLIAGYRDALLRGQVMAPDRWLTLTAVSLVVLLVGYRTYQRHDRRVVKFL